MRGAVFVLRNIHKERKEKDERENGKAVTGDRFVDCDDSDNVLDNGNDHYFSRGGCVHRDERKFTEKSYI